MTAKDFVLAGVALTRAPKELEPPSLVKQRLRVARTTGLVSFNSGRDVRAALCKMATCRS